MNDIIEFVKENLTVIIIVVVIIIMALIGRYGDKRLQEKKRKARLLAMKTNKNDTSNDKMNNKNTLKEKEAKSNSETIEEPLLNKEEIILGKIDSKEEIKADLKGSLDDEEHWEL